jgi:uncharacterized protein YjiS (DUF1127 family)
MFPGTLESVERPCRGDTATSTTYNSTTWLERTSASTRYASGLIWKYWDAIQERRDRQKLRSALSDLSNRELMDIGTTRGEIDYVVSNRGIDPRNIQTGKIL